MSKHIPSVPPLTMNYNERSNDYVENISLPPSAKHSLEELAKQKLYQLKLVTPFIERIKLACKHKQDNSPFQAERALRQALAMPIPKDAKSVVATLRQSAQYELTLLDLENRMKENAVGSVSAL